MYEVYQKAKKLGEREAARRRALGQNPYLSSLDEVLGEKSVFTKTTLGTFEIPAARIVGTRNAGRQNAFAANFMPLLDAGSEFAIKWSNLYSAQMNEGIRDAVLAYEYLGDFYVEEGNKRVSVLKYLEVPTILAQVVRVTPLEWEENERTLAYREFLRFYRACPLYHVRLVRPGGYAKICEAFGETMDTPWPEEKVWSLRRAWYRFEEVYESRMPESAAEHCGEAFVVYLSVYPAQNLLSAPVETVRAQVDKLRGEMTASSENTIRIVEEPIPEKGAPGPVSLLKSLVAPDPVYSPEYPMPVAFMYRGSAKDSAWIRQHDEARKELEHAFGGTVSTFCYENLADDTALRLAVDDAAAREAKVIFTVSADQMPETVRDALHYPQIRFFNCSLNESHPTVPTYFARRYEGKFLLGALAAICARNHRIGYLADLPIYGTMADINAFAIGASLIDPKAKIYLQWWAEKDADWRALFKSQDVMIVCGLDRGPEEEQGLYWTNWEGDRKNLAQARIDWAAYYRRIVKSILDGSQKSFEKGSGGQAINYWYGLSSGVVTVETDPSLQYHTKKMISLLSAAIQAGTLDPFEGELRSQKGLVQGAESPKLPLREIIGMNWLNDNVVGSIPEKSVFPDSSRSVISVSGVKRPES